MGTIIRLTFLLAFCTCALSLIVPEELPTILSLIYSNIPPIKKGTDSRIGIGFRLGEHADFQTIFELGPQTETEPIGAAESKRRREIMLTSAIKGELGPVAQAVAKYQLERILRKELDNIKALQNEKKNTGLDKERKNEKRDLNEQKTGAQEWLLKWRNDVIDHSKNNYVPS